MIEKSEARTMLYAFWGSGQDLDAASLRRIEEAQISGETELQTLARIAGVNVDGVRPFDHAEIRRRIAMAEVVKF